MDDQVCPRCKTTKYRNPSLKLMVNVCGHTLCESCVDLLFLKGSGACPECNIPLRRINFRVQLFEDATVEKEVDIRRKVLRDFNKKEDDFETLREYNDYLEEIETIIFNLVNNIDVPETTRKIEQYKRDNKEQIIKNKSRLGKRENEIEEMLELEKQQELERREEIARQQLEVKKQKRRKKEALIDELMYSEGDAKNIVEHFASSIQETIDEEIAAPPVKVTQFSTGIKFGSQGDYATFGAIPKIDDGPLYSYEPLTQEIEGPEPPAPTHLRNLGYLSHVREATTAERSGGFLESIACLRALQEAMAGLYHFPTRHEMDPLAE